MQEAESATQMNFRRDRGIHPSALEDLGDNLSCLDFVELFVPSRLLQNMAEQTNRLVNITDMERVSNEILN